MLGLGRRQRERELADALAASIDAVQRGVASVDECLRTYPRLADELEPLLRMSAQLRPLSQRDPTEAARLRARAAFLGAAAAQQTTVSLHPLVRRRAWLAFAPVAIAAALFAAVAVPVIGSMDTGAVPGEWNYGFKRATERVQLALTTDSSDRRTLRLEFAKRRLNEMEFLASRSQQTDSSRGTVAYLLRDYTSDIKQVSDALQSAPAVTDSTKQQVESVTQQASTVLQTIASAAPQSDVVNAVTQTQKTAEIAQAAPVTAARPPSVASSTRPRANNTSATAGSDATAQATPTDTPTVTATPTATATEAPSPTASPSATPPVSPTPTPTATSQLQFAAALTATPTQEPATPSPAPTRAVTSAPVIIVTTTPTIETSAGTTASAGPSSPRSTFRPAAPDVTATHTATPTPVPTAAATRSVAAQPVLETVTSSQGTVTYRYLGPNVRLDQIVPTAPSQIAAVYFTQQNGVTGTWYPGSPAPTIGSGALFTVVLHASTVPATATPTLTPTLTPRP